MQIIRELEKRKRGVYCGAIGCIADGGLMQLSVAIRTVSMAGAASEDSADGLVGAVSFGVGAGIIAESDPDAEWRETELKAGGIASALGSSESAAAQPEAGA